MLFRKADRTLLCYPCSFTAGSYTVPPETRRISTLAFEGCGNITFTVERSSFAEKWCRDNGLPFVHTDAFDWLSN